MQYTNANMNNHDLGSEFYLVDWKIFNPYKISGGIVPENRK